MSYDIRFYYYYYYYYYCYYYYYLSIFLYNHNIINFNTFFSKGLEYMMATSFGPMIKLLPGVLQKFLANGPGTILYYIILYIILYNTIFLLYI
jgi:hypothetical protein